MFQKELLTWFYGDDVMKSVLDLKFQQIAHVLSAELKASGKDMLVLFIFPLVDVHVLVIF